MAILAASSRRLSYSADTIQDLYNFVRYSGYAGLVEYAVTAANGMPWPVLALGVAVWSSGFASAAVPATTSAAAALILYVAVRQRS